MDRSIPTPPMEDGVKPSGPRKSTASSTKSVKPIHRNSKRSAGHASHSPVHDHAPTSPHAAHMDRHKRVWKACERCRKTKCDGEFPCKRCKDDGLVCTAGTRKKTEYKQLPRGYAEVLENTQLALIATVHKLYAMVRSGQQWELGEPELNDRGQPVIHNIATLLGCIRPNADADLPPHSVFPEDEAGLAKLAAELEVQQRDRESHIAEHRSETDSTCNRTERAGSSDLDHSDFEQDYRKAVFAGRNIQTMSPASFTSYNDFDTGAMPTEVDTSVMFPVQSPTDSAGFQGWNMPRPTAMDIPPQFMQQMDINMADMMLSQGLVESEFGTIKPHVLSCPNPEVMLGVGDPMIYSGYNVDPLRS
ncbi:hypothetical protein BX600DRAFT_308705 [Xylariales sp. PMI_506]|nr:hypothetical protein BX600DRAFT_308705 [Xylariales sp. PMI_506]